MNSTVPLRVRTGFEHPVNQAPAGPYIEDVTMGFGRGASTQVRTAGQVKFGPEAAVKIEFRLITQLSAKKQR